MTMPDLPMVALFATGVWLCLAALRPLLPSRWQGAGLWALVGLGVPAVGWLTLLWGPGVGVAGFALGLLALLVPPARRRRPSTNGPSTTGSSTTGPSATGLVHRTVIAGDGQEPT